MRGRRERATCTVMRRARPPATDDVRPWRTLARASIPRRARRTSPGLCNKLRRHSVVKDKHAQWHSLIRRIDLYCLLRSPSSRQAPRPPGLPPHAVPPLPPRHPPPPAHLGPRHGDEPVPSSPVALSTCMSLRRNSVPLGRQLRRSVCVQRSSLRTRGGTAAGCHSAFAEEGESGAGASSSRTGSGSDLHDSDRVADREHSVVIRKLLRKQHCQFIVTVRETSRPQSTVHRTSRSHHRSPTDHAHAQPSVRRGKGSGGHLQTRTSCH